MFIKDRTRGDGPGGLPPLFLRKLCQVSGLTPPFSRKFHWTPPLKIPGSAPVHTPMYIKSGQYYTGTCNVVKSIADSTCWDIILFCNKSFILLLYSEGLSSENSQSESMQVLISAPDLVIGCFCTIRCSRQSATVHSVEFIQAQYPEISDHLVLFFGGWKNCWTR